jgi:hypothetical protein
MNFASSSDPNGEEVPVIVRKSIGWHLPDEYGRRTPRPCITSMRYLRDDSFGTSDSETGESTPVNDFDTTIPSPMTLIDMEYVHKGFEWDLLPKISMMSRSAPSVFPASSRIYTRFYNYLQRDALKENFGIDLEGMLRDQGGNVDGYFGVWDPTRADRLETWSLHNGPRMLGASEEERKREIAIWASVMSSVRSAMFDMNGPLVVGFHLYKEVRMPAEWAKALGDMIRVKNTASQMALDEKINNPLSPEHQMDSITYQDPSTGNWYVMEKKYEGGPLSWKPKLFSQTPGNLQGLSTPIGVGGRKATFAEVSAVSGQGIATRNFPVAGSGRTLKSGELRAHLGLDLSPLSKSESTYVYPVKDGTVLKTTQYEALKGTWYWTSDSGVTEPVSAKHLSRLKVVFKTYSGFFFGEGVSPELYLLGIGDNFVGAQSYLEKGRVGSVYRCDYVGTGWEESGWFWINGPSSGNTITIQHGDGSVSRYMHLESITKGLRAGVPVSVNTVIGVMGQSGTYASNKVADFLTTNGTSEIRSLGAANENLASFGIHLHLEYEEPFRNSLCVPSRVFTYEGEVVDPGKTPSTVLVNLKQIYKHFEDRQAVTIPEDYVAPEYKEYIAEATVKAILSEDSTKPKTQTEEEQLQSVAQELEDLVEDGWANYGGSGGLGNVYEKAVFFNFRTDQASAIKLPDNLVYTFQDTFLTGVSASYGAILSRIPLLGHEYPTLQHLGSNEPSYSFEFAALDTEETLDGVSSGVRNLESMRARLQKNARLFREVPNSWSCLMDTFLTRLMGSYKETDVVVDSPGEGLPSRLMMKKRMNLSRTEVGTIQGNPGASFYTVEAEETNVFETEILKNTNSQFTTIENARQTVLHKLLNLEVKDVENEALTLAIAKALAPQALDPANPMYGIIDLSNQSLLNSDLYLPGPEDSSSKPDNGSLENLVSFLMAERASGEVYSVLEETELGGLLGEFPKQPFAKAEEQYSADKNKSGIVVDLTKLTGVTLNDSFLDIKELLANNGGPEGAAAFLQMMDLHFLLKALIEKSCIVLAEDKSRASGTYPDGGFTVEEARSELYQMPITPSMWSLFTEYERVCAQRFSLDVNGFDVLEGNSEGAIATLESNANWNTFEPVKDGSEAYVNKLTIEARKAGLSVTNLHLAFDTVEILTSSAVEGAADTALGFASYIPGASLAIDRNGESEGLLGTRMFDASVKNALSEAHEFLVEGYINSIFKSAIGLTETAKAYGQEFIFRPLQALVTSSSTGYSPLDNPIGAFTKHVESSGYWGYGFHHFLGLGPNTGGLTFWAANPEDYVIVYDKGYEAGRAQVTKQIYEGVNGSMATNAFAAIASLANGSLQPFDNSNITQWNSPLEWKVTRPEEKDKVDQLKREFSSLADSILNNYNLLKLFGLEKYTNVLNNEQYLEGTEAYPDLKLPAHPFYGTVKDTGPDFYYWNVYEDGQMLDAQVVKSVEASMDEVVKNAYQSMRRFQSGEKYNPVKDPSTNYSKDVAQAAQGVILFNAEATDGNSNNPANKGRTSISFYEYEKTEQIAEFENALTGANGKEILKRHPKIPNLFGTSGISIGSEFMPDNFAPIKQQDLENLEKTLEETQSMFGSRSGYLKEKVGNPLTRGLEGTNRASTPDITGHSWTMESLQGLAKESAKDIFSQKMTMARAYPTFKLFFVEEDEIENALISLDDFHSYNGVKDFTFVESKDSPASVAVISLQNVSGVLDGTKRNVVTDLDYFDRKITKSLEKNQSHLQGDVLTEGTDYEQPFGSVVLRPGLNVQLRVGYSNDPKNLSVLLSGRIVDISWNKNNDLAEIVVQSFGTELIQQKKEDTEVHYTTHHLLSHLMLSPELVHFGRWEIGKLFQTGESKDARMDFTNYAREGLAGKFAFTTWTNEFLANNTYILVALGMASAVASFFPAGKLLGKAGAAGAAAASGAANASKVGRMTSWVKELLLKAADTLPASKSASLARLFITPSKEFRLTQLIEKEAAKVAATSGRGLAPSIQNLIAQGNIKLVEKLLMKAVKEDTVYLRSLIKALNNKEANDAVARAYANYFSARSAAVTAGSIDNAIAAGVQFRSELQYIYGSMKVLDAPALSIKEVGKVIWSNKMGALKAGGFFAARTVGGGLTAGSVLAAGAVGGDFLAMTDTAKRIRDQYLYYLSRFLAATEVSLMVSPQDDNIFAPHPKDYMDLKIGGILEGLSRTVTYASASILLQDNVIANDLANLVTLKGLFDKRVDPRACQYSLNKSTIWEVFQEMSYRHPGWVYGARPYGTAFRYTMFFGVPSQRYWSQPGSDSFITRMNQLTRVLEKEGPAKESRVTEQEYRELYGDNLHGMTIADWYAMNPGINLETEFKGVAMKEYLKGMEARFVPFRRHHHLSAHTDIVWNGLLSSENAASNAINVHYYETGSNPEIAGNQVVKAHSFIPPHMTRVHDMPIYRNCKSDRMARRYALGGLMEQMKKTYRGEILVVGNARIRPWDIAILCDSYNDMYGPIEVDQVVHTFSYETGFVTEIKPAAVVIANEISSWPLIEAAKIASLAIEDITLKANSTRSSKALANANGLSALTKGTYGVDAMLSLARDFSQEEIVTLKSRWLSLSRNSNSLYNALEEDPELASALSELDPGIAAGYETALASASVAVALTGTALGLGTLALAQKSGITSLGSKNLITGVAGLGTLVASGALWSASNMTPPSLISLLGGSILFLQTMKEESMMLIPLVKSGRPIVSGLSLKDPSIMWKNFKGNITREFEDTFDGLQDLQTLFNKYQTGAWEKIVEASEEASYDRLKSNRIDTSTP